MGFLLFPPPPPPPRNKYIKNGEGVKFILKNISAPRSPFPPFVSLRAFPQFSSLRPKSDRNWNCCLSTPPHHRPPPSSTPSFPAAPRFFPPPSPKPVAPSSCPLFSHPCSFWVLMKRIWGSRGGARGSRWEPLCFCSSEGESGGEKTGQKKEGSALCLHPAFPKNPQLLQQVGYFPQTSSFFF